MESMTYATAGMLDTYEKPDVALESAATKVFLLIFAQLFARK
jgi:hypothetical protein